MHTPQVVASISTFMLMTYQEEAELLLRYSITVESMARHARNLVVRDLRQACPPSGPPSPPTLGSRVDPR